MKRIKLAKRWRDRVSDTVVHEYAKGSTVDVAEAVATRADKAGVLDGPPVDVKGDDKGKPGSPETPGDKSA